MESRIYKIYGDKNDLDMMEEVLKYITILSETGCSRCLNLFVDGDGSFKIKIRKEDESNLKEIIILKNKIDDDENMSVYLG